MSILVQCNGVSAGKQTSAGNKGMDEVLKKLFQIRYRNVYRILGWKSLGKW
jgi:hypothetical protein